MKTSFIIELPSKKVDPIGRMKSALVNNMLTRASFLKYAGIDEPRVERGIQYAGPGDLITFGLSQQHHVSWAPAQAKSSYSYRNTPVINLYDDFFEAMSRFEAFVKSYYYKPDYDAVFEGRPVRFFDNFIQIGYDIIPRYTSRERFYALPQSTLNTIKQTVINNNSNY